MSLISDVSLHPEQPEHVAETRLKRKRDHDTASIELDRRPFGIKVNPSDPFEAPRIFTPLCLISRAQLPLAYLDTSSTRSQLFSAHISILEKSDVEGSSVLVAEDKKARTLYAIERTQRRTYALCKLGSWVTQQQLEFAAALMLRHDEPQAKRHAPQLRGNTAPWWMRATVGTTDGDLCLALPKLAMRFDVHNSGDKTQAQPDGTRSTGSATATLLLEDAADLTGTDSGEPLQELAKQYLDTLYLSRTSLAYFSKGPLSRARAAFCGGADLNRQPSELINFLREAVLSASVMDKKYKAAATEAIKELPVTGLETPEQQSKVRKKRKWKSKRDKNGFFQNEKEYLEKWWRTEEDSHAASSSVETIDEGLKRRLPRLRSRETYLQIIMALEILALEAADRLKLDNAQASDPSANTVGDVKSQIANTQALVSHDLESPALLTRKHPKFRKPLDLVAILDTSVDRLCISHSLSSHSPARKHEASNGVSPNDATDDLKSFCIEVIIPFYVPRIPQHAASLNRKLGGPSAPTPVKRSSLIRKPGDPATRPVPDQRPRRPLSRVASDAVSGVKRQMPSLHRSATDTDALVPHVKREGSATPTSMDGIPPAKIPPRRKRSSLMQSQSFTHLTHREVDLTAASKAIEAKKRKNANVTQQVQDAISALRKPNRALAVTEIAASADASHAKATARSRPAAAPKKKADAQLAFHVAATPKHRRPVKAFVGTGDGAQDDHLSATSATSLFPASSLRGHGHAHEPPTSSFAVPQTGHRPRHSTAPTVEDTPSRGLTRSVPSTSLHGPDTLESPTLTWRSAAIQETPAKPVRTLLLNATTPALVAASPNPVRAGLPPKPEEREAGAKQDESMNIYDTLGWNDDYDELV